MSETSDFEKRDLSGSRAMDGTQDNRNVEITDLDRSDKMGSGTAVFNNGADDKHDERDGNAYAQLQAQQKSLMGPSVNEIQKGPGQSVGFRDSVGPYRGGSHPRDGLNTSNDQNDYHYGAGPSAKNMLMMN